MPMDDYVESRCDDCDSPLVQLDGDWFCPECNESDEFHLVNQSDDFTL